MNRQLKILWTATAAAGALGVASVAWPFLESLEQPLKVLAYAVALVYWLRIAADHPKGSTMRVAWLLLAWSSAVSIIRHGFQSVTYFTPLPSISSFVQVPIVLALLLLIGGLLAIWLGFAAIGMGVRFKFSDLVWIAVMLVLAIAPYLFSWHAHFGYALIRPLISLSPLLLAAPALLALLLHRIEQEMGGGQLATSLRLIVSFLVLRMIALAVNAPGLVSIPMSREIVALTAWTSIWIFTLAAAYRWRLTLAIRDLTARYQADPQNELADLVLLTESQQESPAK